MTSDSLDDWIDKVRADLPADAEVDQELRSMTVRDRDELAAAFRESYLRGVGPIRDPKHAAAVAEMMAEHVTSHARQLSRLYREVPRSDLRGITAANLAIGAWLHSLGMPPSLVEELTHIEGQCVVRSFLVGLWQSHDGKHAGGLLSGLKAKRTVPTLPEGQARAQADWIRGHLLEIGVAAEIAEAVAGMLVEHSLSRTNGELLDVQKGLSPHYCRERDMFLECLADRMHAFLPSRAVDAVMVLANHASFKALLAGYRSGSGAVNSTDDTVSGESPPKTTARAARHIDPLMRESQQPQRAFSEDSSRLKRLQQSGDGCSPSIERPASCCIPAIRDAVALNHSGGNTDGLNLFQLQTKVQLETDCVRNLSGLTSLEWLDLGHNQIGDEAMSHIQGLVGLRVLDLSYTELTDAGMTYLARMVSLEELDLRRTHITDAGLVHLGRLSRLKRLNLSWTEVTEVGVAAHLTELSELQDLGLACHRITDERLPHLLPTLRRLTKLTRLALHVDGVSDDGLAVLRSELPQCWIGVSL
jgi:hypothetical protein